MDVGQSWLSNTFAAARIAGHLLTGPLLRRYRITWGATDEEVNSTWPGDELVAQPAWVTTHAVAVDAPADDVWPWLAQIGQGQGGLYSSQRFENLIGCQIENTDRILPEHRDLSPVTEIRLAPQAALPLARVEPGRDIVLGASPSSPTGQGPGLGARWSLHLRPDEHGGTRLVERLSFAAAAGDTWQERTFASQALVEPVSFVLSQEMLRNIKRLAGGAGTGAPDRTLSRGSSRQRWKDLTARQQTAILVLASVQLSLAAAAWADLAQRPARDVRGRKSVWGAVITVNFVGPVLYFMRGVRR